MALMEQLLNLNNKIQDFKLSQCAALLDASSDESDDPNTLLEKPLIPKRWHSQGSLRFDRPNQVETVVRRPAGRYIRGNVDPNNFFTKRNNQTKEKEPKAKRWHSQGSLLLSDRPKQDIAKSKITRQWLSRESLSSDDSDVSEISMEPPVITKRWIGGASRESDGSDYHSASSRSSNTSGSNPSLNGSDVTSVDSGHESSINIKSGQRQRKGKLGNQRRVSFGNVREHGGSEVILPPQSFRRYSDFRVAEVRPIMTLSKRQSTIW